MRLLFTLMTLLHFQLLVQCSYMDVTMIRDRLDTLNKHVKMNTNCTLSELKVPSKKMQDHAVCCVPEFKNLTREMLSCVTVPAKYEHFEVEVLNSLELPHEPTPMDGRCGVKSACTSKLMANTLKFEPFTQHVIYLKKLNKRRRRTT